MNLGRTRGLRNSAAPCGRPCFLSLRVGRVHGERGLFPRARLGQDAFGDIALATWKAEGITPRVALAAGEPTGAAYIFVSDETGETRFYGCFILKKGVIPPKA